MNVSVKFETYCKKTEDYIEVLKMTCQPCKYGNPVNIFITKIHVFFKKIKSYQGFKKSLLKLGIIAMNRVTLSVYSKLNYNVQL